ncbi:MAG TPA: hypothetical protein VML53_01680 [Thermoplasmata archaeon]|nr:hypothetical protein [Thermoplasmata archaeon]
MYHKWLGAHWSLASLADLGYPPGDPQVERMARRALALWLRPAYFRESARAVPRDPRTPTEAVPRIHGRYRRCASQQGNALLYCVQLGVAEDDWPRLAERLVHWQWPDGGWNCDRTPTADTSSFAETLTPMNGLAAFGRRTGRTGALAAARRASEVFLRRRLFRRVSDGRVIHPDFVALHYPLYWHYDLLGGLKAMAALGRIRDPRCREALDLLESKELKAGGWSTERRFYDRAGERPRRGRDRVGWGPGAPRANEWVTADALTVLSAAGRFAPP